MHLLLTPRTLPDVESANVVAESVGSEHPEEIVLTRELWMRREISLGIERLRMALRHVKLVNALARLQQLADSHTLARTQPRNVGR